MAKAQAKLKYNPNDVEFWQDHWALRALVETLKVRTELKAGDDLRVMVMRDDVESTLFLIDAEVGLVEDLLEIYIRNSAGRFDDTRRDIAKKILKRLEIEDAS